MGNDNQWVQGLEDVCCLVNVSQTMAAIPTRMVMHKAPGPTQLENDVGGSSQISDSSARQFPKSSSRAPQLYTSRPIGGSQASLQQDMGLQCCLRPPHPLDSSNQAKLGCIGWRGHIIICKLVHGTHLVLASCYAMLRLLIIMIIMPCTEIYKCAATCNDVT